LRFRQELSVGSELLVVLQVFCFRRNGKNGPLE
jgi:hypothetical protein